MTHFSFFLYIVLSSCEMIKLKPRSSFSLQQGFEAGKLIKFQFNEENGLVPYVHVKNEKKEIIASYRQRSATLHAKAQVSTNITFSIANQTNNPMNVWFTLPDVSKEVQGPLGPINDSDIVSELKYVLENIILSQRKHLQRQVEHENLLKSSKRLMTFLLIFEGLFCAGVVYYLHRETIKLFENKRRI